MSLKKIKTWAATQYSEYCKTSNIRHTKSLNLNVCCLALQLFLLNPLNWIKSGVKSRMKMQLEQLQLHLSDPTILLPTKVQLILEV